MWKLQLVEDRERFIKVGGQSAVSRDEGLIGNFRLSGSLIKHVVDSIRQDTEIVNRPLIAGGIGVDVASRPSREADRADGRARTNPRCPRTSARARATVNRGASV